MANSLCCRVIFKLFLFKYIYFSCQTCTSREKQPVWYVHYTLYSVFTITWQISWPEHLPPKQNLFCLEGLRKLSNKYILIQSGTLWFTKKILKLRDNISCLVTNEHIWLCSDCIRSENISTITSHKWTNHYLHQHVMYIWTMDPDLLPSCRWISSLCLPEIICFKLHRMFPIDKRSEKIAHI